MNDFQQKGNIKKLLESWPVLILLFVLLIFFIFGVFRLFVKMRETAKNRRVTENKLSELSTTRDILSADINSLNTNKGLEENIREKFGLAKEGEGLIVVVEDKNMLDTEVESRNWLVSLLKKLFK